VELEDVESIGFRSGKFYFTGTMSLYLSSIYQYGDLKRIVKDSSYRTKVKLKHFPKIPEEIEHASKVG